LLVCVPIKPATDSNLKPAKDSSRRKPPMAPTNFLRLNARYRPSPVIRLKVKAVTRMLASTI